MRNKMMIIVLIGCMFLTGCACKHEWYAATCDAPQTCELCGLTEGEPLEHIPQGEISCETSVTCSLCGETLEKAPGHKWKEATRHSAQTCTVCYERVGEPLTALQAYPKGKPRHNGKTFLMNVDDYIELYDGEFGYGSGTSSHNIFLSELDISSFWPQLWQEEGEENTEVYDLMSSGVSDQIIRFEYDPDTLKIIRISIEIDGQKYSEEQFDAYMQNCVNAYLIANGNMTMQKFVDQLLSVKQESLYANTATGCNDGVAYRLEVRYNSVTMEIWVEADI